MDPKWHGRVPLEVQESLDAIEAMPVEDLCDYFDRLAEDHIESGSHATAADYIEAADRLRRFHKTIVNDRITIGRQRR